MTLRETEPGWQEEWFCKDCGNAISETPTLADRAPCSHCGGTARTGKVLFTAKIGHTAGVKIKGFSESKRPKKPGKSRKPFYEEISLPDLNRNLGIVTWRHRVIDYVSNLYKEKIVRRDNKAVLRDVNEPLSSHQGRGSARRK